MRVKLAERWIDVLVRAPESGMGYQRVDVRFANGRMLRNALVFNAEQLEVPEELSHLEIREILIHRG